MSNVIKTNRAFSVLNAHADVLRAGHAPKTATEIREAVDTIAAAIVGTVFGIFGAIGVATREIKL